MSFTSGSAFECHPFGLSFGNMEETQTQILAKQSAVMTVTNQSKILIASDSDVLIQKENSAFQPILGDEGFP